MISSPDIRSLHLSQAKRRLNRCRREGATERDLDYISLDLRLADCRDEQLLEDLARLEMEVGLC